MPDTSATHPILDEMGYREIMEIIEKGLEEDIRSGDVTSEACIGEDETISGRLLLKQGGRVAGLPFLAPLFQKVDPKIHVHLFVEEGSENRAGTILGTVSGPARSIFSAERVALNLLQHLSGIATITGEYVERIEGHPCDVLDTRKTLPSLRYLQKYAVRVGGGKNHRWGLDDRFIIKKHHIWFIAREIRHPILEAVRRVRQHNKHLKVEVEVETLPMVKEALEAGADILLLSNMSLHHVRKAVNLIGKKAYVEAAGEEITLDTVHLFAEAGVNGVSVSALTDSVQGINISLRF